MKWYSVKKYRPMSYCECFVLFSNGGYSISTFDGRVWLNELGTESYKNITHFCVPDPVEIEE